MNAWPANPPSIVSKSVPIAAAFLLCEDRIMSGFRAEAHACLGVDLQISDPAPDLEIVRLDYDPNNLHPARFHLLFRALEALHELVVGPRQFVRILHDFENARIVLSLVPAEPHSTDFHDSISIVGLDNRDGKALAAPCKGVAGCFEWPDDVPRPVPADREVAA